MKNVLFPNLEAELKRQGYTQEKYAERLGLTPTAVSYRLRGKINFKLPEMVETSDLLHQPMDVLFRSEKRECITCRQ